MEQTELITVAQYAKRNGISPSAVYKRANQRFVEIDGRKFIRVKKGENDAILAVEEDSAGVTRESLLQQVRELLEERDDLREQLRMTGNIARQCAAAEDKCEDLQTECDGLREELNNANEKIDELKNELQELKTRCAVAESQAQERAASLEWVQGAYQQLQARLPEGKGFFRKLFR